jgi:hypothetical protein
MAKTSAARGVSGTIIAAVLLGMLSMGILYRYWPSDERAIRRHLVHLAEVLSASAGESEVVHITRLAALREYFAPDVRITLAGGQEIASRDMLLGFLSRWTPPPGGFSLEFVDETVVLAGDRATAEVDLTAKLTSKNVQTGESTVDAREVALTMAKVNRDWVITSVEMRETLERP